MRRMRAGAGLSRVRAAPAVPAASARSAGLRAAPAAGMRRRLAAGMRAAWGGTGGRGGTPLRRAAGPPGLSIDAEHPAAQGRGTTRPQPPRPVPDTDGSRVCYASASQATAATIATAAITPRMTPMRGPLLVEAAA
ncbi:hypothetical protein GCM10010228_32860 [Streptomyces massasporeus]|nr:hypothetical protein GCM10010228_32860 [Streptomyces massasporeus]